MLTILIALLAGGAAVVAAGALIVEEAGGRVTRYDGSKLTPVAGQIIASNGVIHEELHDLVVPPGQ